MLTLIDGNSLLFRAYYGVRAGLSRTDGTPTGAVYGFTSMILPILASAKPGDIFACAFDASRITFRNKIYPDYKANRQETPPDLVVQMDLVHRLVEAMGMPVLLIEDVEADDVIATLATKYCNLKEQTRIITSDKDIMQLVSDCVFLYDGMKNAEIREPEVLEKFGVRPDQVIDTQALMGDSSDNVPGVPGVGPKTASNLINQFGSLDEIYKNINQVENKRIKNLLIDNEGMARMSKELVTLKTDVNLEGVKLEPFKFDLEATTKFLKEEVESNSLIKRIENLFESKSASSVAALSKIKSSQHKTILTLSELDDFLSTVKDVLAFDTETTGLNQMEAKIVGIALSSNTDSGVYIPIKHTQQSDDLFESNTALPKQLSLDVVKQKLYPFLTNNNITKIAHNIKYDFHILENEGWDTADIKPVHDTMVMSYVLHGSLHLHNLDELAKLYLGHENIPYASLFPEKDKEKRFDTLDISVAAPYASEDTIICLSLYQLFTEKLNSDKDLKTLYETCDKPLPKILMKMERNGVLLDQSKLLELSEILHKQLNILQKSIWQDAESEFNIASPKQLGEILFDKMGLPSGKKRSTDAQTLSDLSDSHEIIDKVLEYRSIAKLSGTYTDALPQQIGKDGRIHTSYMQISTNTGRLSSRDPNLQNIPTRTQMGEKIRHCFIAAPGQLLLSSDYSQIQLRLLADVADVKSFKETFINDKDIHEQTARKIFNIKDSDPVPKDLRHAAKTVNFSIIYGVSSFGLANQLNISRHEAQQIIDSYMKGLPEVHDYMEKTKKFALDNACVYTPWGRKIELPEIRTPRLRAYALRAAINAPIQGFEADIMRLAMINIDKNITGNNPDIKMIMQVHDEMVFEVKEDKADEYAQKVKFEMESAANLSVPLKAEFTISKNWE